MDSSTQAHEQYDDFVDINGPILSLSEFITRRNLPLNEQYASVFNEKTRGLKPVNIHIYIYIYISKEIRVVIYITIIYFWCCQ